MKLNYIKTFLTLFLALVGVIIILYQQYYRQKDAQTTLLIESDLKNLQKDIVDLKYSLLQSEYFLYFNNDIVSINLKKTVDEIDKLLKLKHLSQNVHFETQKSLQKAQREIFEIRDKVYRVLMLNASIKNSTIYISTLLHTAYGIFDLDRKKDKSALFLLTKINNTIFLSKNALDDSFVDELKSYQISLKSLIDTCYDRRKKQLLQVAMGHLNVFVTYFPEFSKNISTVLKSPLDNAIKQIYENFQKETKESEDSINNLSLILLFLYMLSIIVILYFIFKSEKENLILKKVYAKLKKSYAFDTLTGLKNRSSYRKDKDKYKHPALILININSFKRVNEFYGVVVGDAVLKEVANSISGFWQKSDDIVLYRMGGDDFGLLFEYRDDMHLESMAEEILSYFHTNSFEIGDVYVDISVSIGISREKRLLESADMALKHAKSSKKKHFFIYNSSLDITEQLKKNIQELKQLKGAINSNNIFPYFQPIFNINNKIEKFEILARLRRKDGVILTPYHFLNAAKEAKLSGKITILMLKSAFEVLENLDTILSINISVSDMVDNNITRDIIDILELHKNLTKKIIFEILESEEIEDYREVRGFVRKIKRYGCKISIDDFGSGYSSFEELLRLDIDILKIDGTLIKDVDKDKNAQLLVEAIISFAKSAGIETVAEYVHSREVLEKIISLGVDYTQGFYLGKPLPDITNS